MRLAKLVLAILGLCVIATSLGADSPAPVVDATNVSTFYKNYKRLTKEARNVGVPLSTLCAPATLPQDRKKTYGQHANGRVQYFVNPTAETTLKAGPKATFAAGSVIVKEKLSADGSVVGIGGMIKR